MKVIKGKYNFANVMIDEIDSNTEEQIKGFLDHPAFSNSYIAIMPDCHYGMGAVIGLTMQLNDYVIPNIIGVDIGCGMLTRRLKIKDINLENLDIFIRRNIPHGFSIHGKAAPYCNIGNALKDVCRMTGVNHDKTLRAMGSLGGGNHFIEAGRDKDGYIVITIHSGSRGFGNLVARFYQKEAKENLKKHFISGYKDLEFLHKYHPEAESYIYAMRVAQKFASHNRKAMMDSIETYLNISGIEEIESVHNFIGDDDIVRKGATSAREGEKVIIPFNMADGIAICVGKGSSKYNYSAPHGAGRILSRTKAKKTLDLNKFKQKMSDAGVYTTTANKNTLDESPMAYKPKQVILDNIKETVDVIEFIKPIYNFKNDR